MTLVLSQWINHFPSYPRKLAQTCKLKRGPRIPVLTVIPEDIKVVYIYRNTVETWEADNRESNNQTEGDGKIPLFDVRLNRGTLSVSGERDLPASSEA